MWANNSRRKQKNTDLSILNPNDMDYEKKYNEALERAKEFMTNKGVAPNADAFKTAKELTETIFPELKEREDERIRKWIRLELESKYVVDNIVNNVMADKALDWLEKQSEQEPTPKFKISDTIHKIGENTVFPMTIEKIEYGYYVCNNSHSFVNIKFQDDYELVEYKPADKVEPKFKVGDWCIDNEDSTIYQITKVLSNLYHYRTNEGIEYSCTRDSIELDAHLWTIQDAKDGDVLFTTCDNINEMVFIYHGIEFDVTHCYFLYSKTNNECKTFNPVCSVKVDIYPATKEQRDLLFQKMKEVGYEWNAEKKELKKIEKSCYRNDGLYYAMDILEKTFGKVEGYQSDDGKMEHQAAIETVNALYHKKPNIWSEDDEEKLNSIIEVLGEDSLLVNWLKSIKDRVRPQPKQEWNKEDEKILKELIEEVKDQLDSVPSPDCMDKEDEKVLKQLNKWMDWLKSLKDRVQPQPKQEWRKEDNKMLNSVIQRIKALDHYWNKPTDEKMIDWVKSLKPHWKPSEEQIKSLRIALQSMPYSKDKETALSLLEQLVEL